MPDVLLNDEDGNPVTVPESEASDALASGFSKPTKEQVKAYVVERRNQEKYGEGFANEAKAFGLGAAETATFGLSNQALVRSGFAKPETLRQIEERNPTAYTAGQVGGVLGSLLLPEAGLVGGVSKVGGAVERGAAAMLPAAESLGARVVEGAATKGLGSAVEGAFYGAGAAISEQALGDPDLNAEKVMGEIGYGALFGGAIGSVFGAIAPVIVGKPAAKSVAEAVKSTEGAVAPQGVSSLGDMAIKVESGAAAGLSASELPQKAILQEADSVLKDSKFPVHNVQLESMNDPNIREIYKAVKESNTAEGKILRDYEALQKSEGVKMLDSTIRSVAPGAELTADAYKGGLEIGNAFEGIYKEAKSADKEVFEALKKVAPNLRVTSADLLKSVQQTFPAVDLGNVMKLADDGALLMKPYKSAMPISKEAYTAIKEIVDGMEGHQMTVEGLRNVREAVADKITFDLAARPKSELGSIKKNLMTLMEDTVQTVEDKLPVRDAFKRYAINEAKRADMEAVFGGKLDDSRGLLKMFKPEELGDKVFRNSATMQVARDILPKEVFDKMVGNYLLEQVQKFTDQGKFSSQRFATWLKGNQTEIGFALADNKEVQNRLVAIADKLRILPDSAPLNPPNTAKAIGLFSALDKISNIAAKSGRMLEHPLETSGKFLQGVAEKIAVRGNMNQIEAILTNGASAEISVSKMGMIEKMVNNVTKNIDTMSARVLNPAATITNASKNVFVKMSAEEKAKELEKIKDKIISKTNSPDNYVNTVSESTKQISDVAPQISAGIQVSTTKATEFLKSKMPNTNPVGPLSPDRKPSDAELSKFFRYYTVIENPLSVLHQVKDGTLTPESMEVMNNVYPRLLGDMRTTIFDKLAGMKKRNDIPYKTKVVLSAFLGADIAIGIKQDSLMHNQMAFSAPSEKQDAKDMAMAQQKPSQSGAKAITIAQRSDSFTRRVIDRKA